MAKNNFVPEELAESCSKELDAINDRTMTRLFHENNLDVADKSVVYTVATKFLEETAKYLGEHPDVIIDISSLLIMSVENRPDDSGEKAGNIVPLITVGERFKLAVKNDDATEGIDQDDE